MMPSTPMKRVSRPARIAFSRHEHGRGAERQRPREALDHLAGQDERRSSPRRERRRPLRPVEELLGRGDVAEADMQRRRREHDGAHVGQVERRVRAAPAGARPSPAPGRRSANRHRQQADRARTRAPEDRPRRGRRSTVTADAQARNAAEPAGRGAALERLDEARARDVLERRARRRRAAAIVSRPARIAGRPGERPPLGLPGQMVCGRIGHEAEDAIRASAAGGAWPPTRRSAAGRRARTGARCVRPRARAGRRRTARGRGTGPATRIAPRSGGGGRAGLAVRTATAGDCRLAAVLIREVMTESVVTAAPSASVREIAEMMRERNVGSVVLVEGEQPVAFVTDRDLTLSVLADGRDFGDRASDHASSPVITAEPGMDVQEAAELMVRHGVRRLVVVDDEPADRDRHARRPRRPHRRLGAGGAALHARDPGDHARLLLPRARRRLIRPPRLARTEGHGRAVTRTPPRWAVPLYQNAPWRDHSRMDVMVVQPFTAPAPAAAAHAVELDEPASGFSRRKLAVLAAATVAGARLRRAARRRPRRPARTSGSASPMAIRRWLALAALFEIGSFLGHIVLFNAVGRDDRGAHRRCARAPRSTSPATPPRGCSPPPAPAASR